MDIDGFLKRSGMTQTALASMIGTTPANVSRWAVGAGVPSYELCVNLIKAGMTTRELFGVDSLDIKESPEDFDEKVKKSLLRLLNK